MFCSEKGALEWNGWAETIIAQREKLNDKIANVDYYPSFKVLYYGLLSTPKPTQAAVDEAIKSLGVFAKDQSVEFKTVLRNFISYSKNVYANNECAELSKILKSKGITPRDNEEEQRRKAEEERKKADEERQKVEEEARKRRQQEEERKRQREEEERKREKEEEKKEYNNKTEVRNWNTQARVIIENRNTPDVKPFFTTFLKLYQGMATNLSVGEAAGYIKELRSSVSGVNDRAIKNALLVFCTTSSVAYRPENIVPFRAILKSLGLMPKPNEKFGGPTAPDPITPTPPRPRPTPNPHPEPMPRPRPSQPASAWDRFDWFIEDIGDWFEDISEDVPGAIGIGIYIISWIMLGIGVISTWISEGLVWAILTAVIGGVIVYYAAAIIGFVIAFLIGIFVKVLRYVFYNALSFLIVVGLIASMSVYSAINSWSSSKPVEVVQPAPVATTTYYCTSQSGLNIRSAANASSTVLGTLNYMQEVEVTKEINGFAQIKHGSGYAYASLKYLKQQGEVSNPKPAAKPVTQAAPKTNQSKPVVPEATKEVTKPTEAPKPATSTKNAPEAVKSTTGKEIVTINTAMSAEDYYKQGVNYAKEFKEIQAISALTKACDMGSIDAHYYLGMMRINGGEATRGFPLLLKAAEAGHKAATFDVAECYSAGTGTAKDTAKAKSWYQKAEAMGDSRATSRLRKL